MLQYYIIEYVNIICLLQLMLQICGRKNCVIFFTTVQHLSDIFNRCQITLLKFSQQFLYKSYNFAYEWMEKFSWNTTTSICLLSLINYLYLGKYFWFYPEYMVTRKFVNLWQSCEKGIIFFIFFCKGLKRPSWISARHSGDK